MRGKPAIVFDEDEFISLCRKFFSQAKNIGTLAACVSNTEWAKSLKSTTGKPLPMTSQVVYLKMREFGLVDEFRKFLGKSEKVPSIVSETKTDTGEQQEKIIKQSTMEEFPPITIVKHPLMTKGRRLTYTPSGSCPVKPANFGTGEETTDDDIKNWANKVYNYVTEDGQCYSKEAVLYFAREFWYIHSQEYKHVADVISDTLSLVKGE